MARWTSWAVAISHLRPAELVMIPTGLSRLAGQAIRLVRRLRLSLSCFGLCGWGRPPVDLLVVSPTSVSAQHGRHRLTRPGRAVRAAGVAGWGRAVPGTRATPRPLPVFSRARPGTQAKRPGGSWGQGQRRRRAPQELAEEVQGRTPLLPARPPHGHQDRLGPRTGPGPAAAPDLPQDDAEADGQLRPPVGGVQPGLAQEREQVVTMVPEVLGQSLVGRVRLWWEDQVGQLVLQAAAGHSQTVPADLPRRMAVSEVEP